MKDINDFFYQVWLFNKVAGNLELPKTDKELQSTLQDQVARIKEEVEETQKAISVYEPVEILDGTVDILVTAFGLLAKMQDVVDTVEAAKRVCENNMSKIFTNHADAEDTINYYKSQGVDCYISSSVVNDAEYYAVRRMSDNKIMKPMDFKAVDLSDLVWGAV